MAKATGKNPDIRLTREIALILLLLFSIPGSLFSSVEKEQYPGAFTCKQVDSLIQEALKYKSFNIDRYKYLSRQALDISKGLPCKAQEAKALMHVGCGYLYDESYYLALTSYFESADMYTEINDMSGAILSLAFVVDCYLQIDASNNAFQYVKKIESLLHHTKEPENFGTYYMCRCQYYYKIDKLNEAEKDAYLALYYFAKADSSLMVSRCLKMLGDIKLVKNDFTRSIFFYKRSIMEADPFNESGEIAVLYTRIGHVYQLQQKYDLVLKYNYTALRIREKVGTTELISSSLINIGGSYLRIQQYDSASYYLNKGISMAKNVNRTLLLEHAYLELSRFYTASGNPKLALENYQKYADYHRKLLEDQNNNEIRKLEESRKVRELEMKSALLMKENQLQRLHYRSTLIQTILLEAFFLFACAIVLLIYLLRKSAIRSRLNLISLNEQLESDIAERVEAEKKLRESEELYRFIAEHSVDVVTHLDKNLKRKYISPSCKNVLGFDPQELIGLSPLDLIVPEDHHLVSSLMAEMKKTRKPGSFVCRIRTKEGSRKWVEVTVNPIFDSATGDLKELLTALRDVDERVRSDEAIAQNARQKEILLREIHTRVKNNFAILISLMELQKESSGREGLSRALTDLQLRVRTMSLVHEQLYVSENVRKVNLRLYLLTLVQIISRSYTKEHISLEVNLEEFHCDIELALPVGLIVNELLTNAFKYAFPGKTSGTIRVSLEPYQGEKPGEAAQKGLWILSVKDNGIGLPEFFTSEPRSGMGSQIVRILVDQIEAWLEVLNRDGACFNLVFSEYYKSHA